jgi:phosphoadenosine phosphosulfate reductase
MNIIKEKVTSNDLEKQSAEQRIDWAIQNFSQNIFMSTSFGIQSAVMLHIITQKIPHIPIVFIDTGYLFPETYEFAETLSKRLKLKVLTFKSLVEPKQQELKYGKLWEQGIEGLNKYNKLNKIDPMKRAIKELNKKAWFAGIRREQSQSREEKPVVEIQNNITKIYPIIDWDDRKIYIYLKKNNLPYHPLWNKGYVSVGDWHSSKPLTSNMKPEETRFNGIKRECGLHLDFDQGGGI